MIPDIEILEQSIPEITYPTRTYKIVFRNDDMKQTGVLRVKLNTLNETEYERISGYTDDIGAVAQAIYLILNTERYRHIIYSWDYGVELLDLFGLPMNYVISEIPRRITDALLQDNRIVEVKDFEFDVHKNKLHTTFVVVTNIGNINAEMEVAV